MSRIIYSYHPEQKTKPKKLFGLILVIPVLLALNFVFKPFSSSSDLVSRIQSEVDVVLSETESKIKAQLSSVQPIWTEKIQSATGAVGYGVLAESDESAKAVPMASLSKVMAAILVMEEGKLKPGDTGEDIIFNLDDEAFYNEHLFNGGVVTTVKAGNTVSQVEALKAMLIGSSNNLADTSVRWTFGSLETYLVKANQKAAELGMTNTTYADAAGFSPDSASTAHDLVLLADYAMQNPLFAEIVSTWKVTIMDDVEITSTNTFLDYEGNNVVGIKSGLTDEAGGTFMTAAEYINSDGEEITALAVTLGAKTHFKAQEEAMPLLRSVEAAIKQ